MMNEYDYVLTQNDLVNMFNYDELTGVFKYAKDTRYKKVDDVVGYVANGYLKVNIKGKSYQLSRLAWLYVNGVFPSNIIDHIDHDRSNNRISNLRDVTVKENNRNKSLSKASKSGCLGVSFCNTLEEWQVTINQKWIGSYLTYPEAVKASEDNTKKEGFHTNHGQPKKRTYNHYNEIMNGYRLAGLK